MLNYIHAHQSEEKFLQMQTLDQFIVHLSQENCWISNEKNVLKTIEYLFFSSSFPISFIIMSKNLFLQYLPPYYFLVYLSPEPMQNLSNTRHFLPIKNFLK